MTKQEKRLSPILTDSQINTLAGAASGAFVSILVSPLDVMKTRIQVKRLPKGISDASLWLKMYRLGKNEGFRAFFKGLGTTMLVRKILIFDLHAYFIQVLGLYT
jgi:solute carrier family 25 folate transporter 32